MIIFSTPINDDMDMWGASRRRRTMVVALACIDHASLVMSAVIISKLFIKFNVRMIAFF